MRDVLARIVLCLAVSGCARTALEPGDGESIEDPSPGAGEDPSCACDRGPECMANCVCDPDCALTSPDPAEDPGATDEPAENPQEEDEEAPPEEDPWPPEDDGVEPPPDAGCPCVTDDDCLGCGGAGDCVLVEGIGACVPAGLCLAACAVDDDCLGPCGDGYVCTDAGAALVCLPAALAGR